MDLLSIIAMISVLFRDESCFKPLKVWYVANGIWASISISFMYWFSNYQLKLGYQTKLAVVITYLLELGYIILSIVAWCMLTSPDPNNECE
jgi:hypothetical protein